MKKVFFAVATLAVIGLSSWKECVDCSGVAGTGVGKVCKEDYTEVKVSLGILTKQLWKQLVASNQIYIILLKASNYWGLSFL